MRTFDYSQYEKNCTLSFALASMAFEPYTHIVVLKRVPGSGLQLVGGGGVARILSRYADWIVVRSSITPEGILRIVIKEPG